MFVDRVAIIWALFKVKNYKDLIFKFVSFPISKIMTTFY